MPATSSSTGRRARGKAVAADARTHGNSLLQQAPAGGGVTAKAQRRCSAAAVATLASPWRVVQIRHFGNIGLACSTKIGFFGAVAACRQKKPVMDKNLDQVLPPDSAAKLLRVFCFLRQHERKARIARKTAELNAWRAPPPPDECPAEEELQQASPTESLDKTDLVDELNLLASSGEPDGPVVVANRSKNAAAGIRNVTGAGAATMQELRSEIKELQKEVIASSSDTSGVITAADLSSCMKSLHRVSAKGEVQWMIWEVDNDMDGSVSWEEFKGCYVRTLLDSHGLELNQLYYLTQFLLCDTDGSQTVSADEITAELQRIGGTEHLTSKLWSVLEGESEEQQLLRKLTLSEFLDAMLGDLPATFNLH